MVDVRLYIAAIDIVILHFAGLNDINYDQQTD